MTDIPPARRSRLGLTKPTSPPTTDSPTVRTRLRSLIGVDPTRRLSVRPEVDSPRRPPPRNISANDENRPPSPLSLISQGRGLPTPGRSPSGVGAMMSASEPGDGEEQQDKGAAGSSVSPSTSKDQNALGRGRPPDQPRCPPSSFLIPSLVRPSASDGTRRPTPHPEANPKILNDVREPSLPPPASRGLSPHPINLRAPSADRRRSSHEPNDLHSVLEGACPARRYPNKSSPERSQKETRKPSPVASKSRRASLYAACSTAVSYTSTTDSHEITTQIRGLEIASRITGSNTEDAQDDQESNAQGPVTPTTPRPSLDDSRAQALERSLAALEGQAIPPASPPSVPTTANRSGQSRGRRPMSSGGKRYRPRSPLGPLSNIHDIPLIRQTSSPISTRPSSFSDSSHPHRQVWRNSRDSGSVILRPTEIIEVSRGDRVVAKYQLGNCIGKGQFGAVFRSLDVETGQMVAVKRIPLAGLKLSQVEDVMREVDVLRRLSHPQVVRYEGMSRDEDHLNIVLEYVENGSLKQLLRAFGKLNEKLVSSYTEKILQGLDYLHSQGVVHCDLKAANILSTKDGNVKLSDFGVSFVMKAVEDVALTTPRSWLQTVRAISEVAGTPNWMAPEIISLEGPSPASDIWSLGCTIIELLTGKPPYSDVSNGMTVLFRIVEDDAPAFPDDTSSQLADFLTSCFTKDPRNRPSATTLQRHLWVLGDGSISPPTAMTAEYRDIVEESADLPVFTRLGSGVEVSGASSTDGVSTFEESSRFDSRHDSSGRDCLIM